MSAVVQRVRGRPRDSDIDRRVLQAARELLGTEGFAATTIQAIARAAGVRSSAIYRRWSSRIALIEEAIFPGIDSVAIEPTGDLAADLSRFVAAYRVAIATPSVMAALPALISSYQSGAGSRAPEDRAWRSARPQFRDILSAAPAHLVDPGLDSDDIFDMLVGAVLYKLHILALGARIDAPDRTVELICRMLKPMAPSVPRLAPSGDRV